MVDTCLVTDMMADQLAAASHLEYQQYIYSNTNRYGHRIIEDRIENSIIGKRIPVVYNVC